MLVDLFIMNCDFDTLCSFALLLIKWPILQLQWHIFFLYIRRRVWPMIVKFTSLYFVVVVMWQWYDAIIDHRRQSGRESQTKKCMNLFARQKRREKKTVQLFTFGYDFPRGGLWSSMATAYVPKYRYEPSKLARRKIEFFFFFYYYNGICLCCFFFYLWAGHSPYNFIPISLLSSVHICYKYSHERVDTSTLFLSLYHMPGFLLVRRITIYVAYPFMFVAEDKIPIFFFFFWHGIKTAH